MKKRILAMLLAFTLVILAGCGGQGETETTLSPADDEQATVQETVTETEQETAGQETLAQTEGAGEEETEGESGQTAAGEYRDDIRAV